MVKKDNVWLTWWTLVELVYIVGYVFFAAPNFINGKGANALENMGGILFLIIIISLGYKVFYGKDLFEL